MMVLQTGCEDAMTLQQKIGRLFYYYCFANILKNIDQFL